MNTNKKTNPIKHAFLAMSFAFTLGINTQTFAKYEDCKSTVRQKFEFLQKEFQLNSDNNIREDSLRALKAEQDFEELKCDLSIADSSGKQKNPSTGIILKALGSEYFDRKDYEKSVQMYQRALEIDEKHLDKNDINLAISIENLAFARYFVAVSFQNKNLEGISIANQYQQSIRLYKRALPIFENNYGKNHQSIAVLLNRLSSVYGRMQDYKEERVLLEKALLISKDSVGNTHELTAIIWQALASSYSKTGDTQKQLDALTRSLEIKEIALGKNHEDTAVVLYLLGSFYEERAEYNKAFEYLQRAYDIQINKLRKGHPSTVFTSLALKRVKLAISESKHHN